MGEPQATQTSPATQVTRCSVDELRTLFLFEKLSDEQLQWLCEHGSVEVREPGVVFSEGDDATCFFVLLEGEIATLHRVGEDDVEINRTSYRGAYMGAFSAYLGDRVPQVYVQTMRAVVETRFFVLDSADFSWLMNEWFPMPVHLLEGLFVGAKRTQSDLAQRERLLALGSLSAGLTHELNNPAAAAMRATSSLRERVARMRHKLGAIAGGTWDRNQLERLIVLQERAADMVPKAPDLSPLEANDREDELTDWFDAHGLDDGYELAPIFVAAGIDTTWLDDVAATVDDEMLVGSVHWLSYSLETELLMNEIEDSTTRVSTLVTAAKQYSQMDRAPHQVVDVHELLESTLVMLSRKIGSGVQVVRDYDRALPDVGVYAAELNQVWTNLIDNALQAMDGTGTLTLRTSRVDDSIEVEIGDTGPGIPGEVLPRIFEPFFTTKPVGEGTGLGLDISWRIVVNKHHGNLTVTSEPGDTRFRVVLPLRDDLAESDS